MTEKLDATIRFAALTTEQQLVILDRSPLDWIGELAEMAGRLEYTQEARAAARKDKEELVLQCLKLASQLTCFGQNCGECKACEVARLTKALADCEGALEYAAEVQEAAGNAYGAKKCRERLEHNRTLLSPSEVSPTPPSPWAATVGCPHTLSGLHLFRDDECIVCGTPEPRETEGK